MEPGWHRVEWNRLCLGLAWQPSGRWRRVHTAGGEEAEFIAQWDGSSWHTVGAGMNADVLSLGEFDDRLRRRVHTGRWPHGASYLPFQSQTKLTYFTQSPGPVRVSIYDIQGRHAITLVSRTLSAGWHSVCWKGESSSFLPSGIYLVRIESAGAVLSGRRQLTK